MTLLFAYLLTFFLSPTISALLLAPMVLPLVLALKGRTRLALAIAVAGNAGVAVLTVWIGTKLFLWLD